MRSICLALALMGILAGSAGGASQSGSVDLVAYSTPKDAYGKISSSFQGTAAGHGVDFTQSYDASGDQARTVAAGQTDEIDALSLAPVIDFLVKKNIVPNNWWSANQYHGVASTVLVLLVVR